MRHRRSESRRCPWIRRLKFRNRTQGYNWLSNIGADTNTNQVNITNTYTPFGTVTKTYGPHTFKVGASLRKNQFNSYNPATSPEGSSAVRRLHHEPWSFRESKHANC